MNQATQDESRLKAHLSQAGFTKLQKSERVGGRRAASLGRKFPSVGITAESLIPSSRTSCDGGMQSSSIISTLTNNPVLLNLLLHQCSCDTQVCCTLGGGGAVPVGLLQVREICSLAWGYTFLAWKSGGPCFATAVKYGVVPGQFQHHSCA